jgi:hypothetical protein
LLLLLLFLLLLLLLLLLDTCTLASTALPACALLLLAIAMLLSSAFATTTLAFAMPPPAGRTGAASSGTKWPRASIALSRTSTAGEALMLQKASNARKPRTVSVRFTFAEGGSSGFLNGLRERESERAHGAS